MAKVYFNLNKSSDRVNDSLSNAIKSTMKSFVEIQNKVKLVEGVKISVIHFL